MPHIFFERFEQRKNTQSLLGFSSELWGNMDLFGSSPYSSYSPSTSSLSSYGLYGQSEISVFKTPATIDFMNLRPTCYIPPINPFPMCYLPPPPFFGTDIPIFDRILPATDIWTSPVTNPLFDNFSQPYSLTPGIFTSPYSSGNVFTPGLNVNPLSSPFSGSNVQAPYLGQDILPSSRLDTSILPVMDVNQERISKLGKVRENLIAFFRNKGILNDKQRQRLLS